MDSEEMHVINSTLFKDVCEDTAAFSVVVSTSVGETTMVVVPPVFPSVVVGASVVVA